eukprot:354232-Chlamydomonas_euryale.AAC.9
MLGERFVRPPQRMYIADVHLLKLNLQLLHLENGQRYVRCNVMCALCPCSKAMALAVHSVRRIPHAIRRMAHGASSTALQEVHGAWRMPPCREALGTTAPPRQLRARHRVRLAAFAPSPTARRRRRCAITGVRRPRAGAAVARRQWQHSPLLQVRHVRAGCALHVLHFAALHCTGGAGGA